MLRRPILLLILLLILVGTFMANYWHPLALFGLAFILFGLWLYDIRQTKHAILRNYPIVGHLRYLFEFIRPEIQQYFIASNHSGRPFNRETRSLVYQRSKQELETLPFGTQLDIDTVGFSWANHSIKPTTRLAEEPRVVIGNQLCQQPYQASRLNISAMSFGALSKNAILALNKGAKLGNFYHNTGEGGLSPYHLAGGGDLCWQIGTGYFGCCKVAGTFCPDKFKERSQHEQIKLIEIKLSQGAKPGHGGILPGPKVNKEIAEIRGVPIGEDCVSPASHSAFNTPIELIHFISQLRELSNGKPIGIKLCLGKQHEFMAIIKAMLKENVYPDFITIDGAEGGTGAAPIEFSNHLGMPLNQSLQFIHNALVGCNIRHHIKLIASAKVASGFDLLSKIALGADCCNSARAMMFACGCIQSLRCHTNACPTGIATQNPRLVKGLVVEEKYKRVANYQHATVHAFLDLLAAMGLEHPDQLTPDHLHYRINATETGSYADYFPQLVNNQLLDGTAHDYYQKPWQQASELCF